MNPGESYDQFNDNDTSPPPALTGEQILKQQELRKRMKRISERPRGQMTKSGKFIALEQQSTQDDKEYTDFFKEQLDNPEGFEKFREYSQSAGTSEMSPENPAFIKYFNAWKAEQKHKSAELTPEERMVFSKSKMGDYESFIEEQRKQGVPITVQSEKAFAQKLLADATKAEIRRKEDEELMEFMKPLEAIEDQPKEGRFRRFMRSVSGVFERKETKS